MDRVANISSNIKGEINGGDVNNEELNGFLLQLLEENNEHTVQHIRDYENGATDVHKFVEFLKSLPHFNKKFGAHHNNGDNNNHKSTGEGSSDGALNKHSDDHHNTTKNIDETEQTKTQQLQEIIHLLAQEKEQLQLALQESEDVFKSDTTSMQQEFQKQILAHSEKTSEAAVQFQQQVENLRHTIGGLNNEIHTLAEGNKALKNELETQRTRIAQDTAIITRLEAQLKAKQEECDMLRNEKDEAETSLTQHMIELKETTALIETQQEEFESKLQKLEHELENVNQGVHTTKKTTTTALIDEHSHEHLSTSLLRTEAEKLLLQMDNPSEPYTINDVVREELRKERDELKQQRAEILKELSATKAHVVALQRQSTIKEAEPVHVSNDDALLHTLFIYMALALKYDAMAMGLSCNIDTVSIFEEIKEKQMPYHKWVSFIHEKINTQNKDDNKK